MKTRIISGAVMVGIVAAVLLLWSKWSFAADLFVMILAAAAAYEGLYKTGYNKEKVMVAVAAIYSATVIPFYTREIFVLGIRIAPAYISVLFAVVMIALSLKNHAKLDAIKCGYSIFLPLAISYAFSCFAELLNFSDGHGLLYFLMLLNFSSITDCGAYFIGCAIGKHKMAPVLSPKKTWEGVAGGILSSVVFSIVILLIYSAVSNTKTLFWPLIIFTPVFSVLGMVGDIFFSYIKRCCGIKDYSNLIPGHGGILDRVDSILMIAPILFIFLEITTGVI